MKKTVFGFIAMIIFMSLTAVSVFAAAEVSLSGPSTVRAGDTVTVTLKVTAKEAYGVEGTFDYDKNQVTLSSISCSLSNWKISQNGNNFVAEDDSSDFDKPIKTKTTLLTAKFKVKSSLKAGEKIKISVKEVEFSDDDDTYSDSYSVTLAEPLSDDAKLKELSVKEGTLTPEFSAETTEYDIGEVDFSVSELTITAKTNHSGAEYEIIGNRLSVGKNTVKVIVTAETGDRKEYFITVTRKQDPNYVPSSNAALSEITLSSGILSPLFDRDKLEYIVYVPYETDKITIGGKAEDSLAMGVTGVTEAQLSEGENIFSVTGKAEDGTELVYSVTVMRMEEFGVESEIPPESDDPSSADESGSPVSSEEGSEVSDIQQITETDDGIGIGLTLVLTVAALVMGLLIGILAAKPIWSKRSFDSALKDNESFFKDKN